MTDSELLHWYNQGWNDECKGTTSTVPPEAEHAYNIGVLDYIAGDDVKSIDTQTNDQILVKIKNNK